MCLRVLWVVARCRDGCSGVWLKAYDRHNRYKGYSISYSTGDRARSVDARSGKVEVAEETPGSNTGTLRRRQESRERVAVMSEVLALIGFIGIGLCIVFVLGWCGMIREHVRHGTPFPRSSAFTLLFLVTLLAFVLTSDVHNAHIWWLAPASVVAGTIVGSTRSSWLIPWFEPFASLLVNIVLLGVPLSAHAARRDGTLWRRSMGECDSYLLRRWSLAVPKGWVPMQFSLYEGPAAVWLRMERCDGVASLREGMFLGGRCLDANDAQTRVIAYAIRMTSTVALTSGGADVTMTLYDTTEEGEPIELSRIVYKCGDLYMENVTDADRDAVEDEDEDDATMRANVTNRGSSQRIWPASHEGWNVEESRSGCRPPPGGLDPMNWFVLRVKPGEEVMIRDALLHELNEWGCEHLIDQIVTPTEEVRSRDNVDGCVDVKRPYPGYLFVEMRLEGGRVPQDVFFLLREVKGVYDFIGKAGCPSPMHPAEVDKVLHPSASCEPGAMDKLAFRKQDHVKVIDGPFRNMEGVIHDILPENGKMTVMLTVFGRVTPIELEYWQLEKRDDESSAYRADVSYSPKSGRAVKVDSAS